jgi:hypothetical protein
MNKKIILSCMLFLIVFCILGIPFSDWWFNGDDFSGIAIAYHTKTWSELFAWFLDGNIARYFYASHDPRYVPPGQQIDYSLSCFGFYYRPLYCVYLTFLHWIFALNAYPFYLANVFFHGLNAVILFNVCMWFVGMLPAFLFALLFAFHPQVGFRFGSIVNIHYYIDLFLILTSLLAFKKFFDTKKYLWNVISCVLFLLALFTRETAIVLPALIFLGSCYYLGIVRAIWYSLGHALCAFFYLAVRFMLYPAQTSSNSLSGSTQNLNVIATKFMMACAKIPSRSYELITFLYDVFALSWLPWGFKTLRGVVMLAVITFFSWLFIKSRNKPIILFFALCSLLMLWPAMYINYSPRYFYEAYPFILLVFVCCWVFTEKNRVLAKTFGSIFVLFVAVNMVLTFQNLKTRELKLHQAKTAILDLVRNPEIKNRALCIMGFPIDGFGTGIEQAIWIFSGDSSSPIYYDPCTMIVQADSNLVYNKHVCNKVFYTACASYFDQNYISIEKIHNGFRFVSHDPEKVFFNLNDAEYLSLGKKVIHAQTKINDQSVVTDFSLIVDQKFLDQNPLFIAWNYQSKQFDLFN